MMKPLPEQSINDFISGSKGWIWTSNTLTKKFSFTTFRKAVAFIVQVAFEAESVNHHPEIHNVYNRVVIKLSTHDAGDKVTEKDLELAGRIDQLS